ncbi:MAG: undecaprenyl-diphosphate phosphatase [Clostridiales Family XIII bacterium]|jgi:undecaprenyl-diphosphatase|nr:undecaprenyl-diphosphate phosphatase [Clostridiales Family XIII bacterium]
MTIFESVLQGLTQGLTEFIPVSSSGHEVLLQNVFSGESDHSFLEFINIGTLLALIVFFRSKIRDILVDVFKNHDFKLARNLIITSVPAGIIGLALSGFINENPFFGSVVTVVVALSLVGAVMLFLEKLPRADRVENGAGLTPWRALIIGLVQSVALIPGVSRSGSTIIAGRLCGLPTREAAEYSFLASIPIMLGVAAKLFISSSDRAYLMDNLQTLAISNLVAFVAGMAAIGFMLKYLARKDLKVFGVYRILLAFVVLLLFFFGNRGL